jgi:ParB family transcriptional regulator, chromosome partitioning protein
MAKKRLGIDALFQSSVPRAAPAEDAHDSEFREIGIDLLHAGSRQPRRRFEADGLEQLTASIATRGVLQPLLVRMSSRLGYFEIIAGERRWRAARAAGLTQVPVRVVTLDDTEALLVAITENLQREDLSPIDEAEGYLELLKTSLEGEPGFASYRDPENGTAGVVRLLRALNNRAAGNTKDNVVLSLEPTVARVFDAVGRLSWQSFLAHRLPLLSLPDDVLAAVRDRGLAYTKARAIARLTAERLGADEPAARKARRDLIEQAISEGLSIRSLAAEIGLRLGTTRDRSTSSISVRQGRRRSGLEGRIDELQERLGSVDIEDYGPAKRTDILNAIEALLRVL